MSNRSLLDPQAQHLQVNHYVLKIYHHNLLRLSMNNNKDVILRQVCLSIMFFYTYFVNYLWKNIYTFFPFS